MKVVVAMDSFKGSVSSLEAGRAVLLGIRRVLPEAEVIVRPMADGGEGTVEALTVGMRGHFEAVEVTGPLGEKVTATYGILGDRQTAIIEISAAAGIFLVKEEERNPMHTTSYGVGELIVHAISKGCRHFIIGLGGSATNDGGIGMLQALGVKFLDAEEKQVCYGAEGLGQIVRIDTTNLLPQLSECTFRVACDVTNPLCGEQGATAVFSPQKGATQQMVTDMEAAMKRYAEMVLQMRPEADAAYPGSGAAGGLGFAFHTFLHGKLESGVQIVLEETGLESYLKDADLVITGEGRLDGQTVMGKAPIGVARLAKKFQKKVIAFAGCITEEAEACLGEGIDAYFCILPRPVTLNKAMRPENAKKNLTRTAQQVMRLLS
ncbi:glycerate kinase [Lachnospiraceae bacterium XBB1006]|nr:glycerate kinase [Lachnospiraceae bacterium XBB1006]